MPREGYGNKTQNAVIRRIMQSSNVDRSSAIAIAKSQGLVKQKGGQLVATDKGRKAGKKASRTLKKKGHSYNRNKDRWGKKKKSKR